MKEIYEYKMFDPIQIGKGLPSGTPGNYIFLMRPDAKLPEGIIDCQPTFKTLNYEGEEYRVLYTGVTEKDTLYERIFKTHFGDNAGKSTLRKSLGCLWGYPFILRDKNPNPSKKPKTKYRDEDEQAITQWMKKNLLVLFVQNFNCDSEETELIKAYNPPLNLNKNKNVINCEYRSMIRKLRVRPVE